MGTLGYSLVEVVEIRVTVLEPAHLAAILVCFLPQEEIQDLWIHQECLGTGLQSALQVTGLERWGQIQVEFLKKGYTAWEV